MIKSCLPKLILFLKKPSELWNVVKMDPGQYMHIPEWTIGKLRRFKWISNNNCEFVHSRLKINRTLGENDQKIIQPEIFCVQLISMNKIKKKIILYPFKKCSVPIYWNIIRPKIDMNTAHLVFNDTWNLPATAIWQTNIRYNFRSVNGECLILSAFIIRCTVYIHMCIRITGQGAQNVEISIQRLWSKLNE